MSFTVKETKTYHQPAEAVIKSAVETINQLGGKPSKKHKPEQGHLDANFNKKIGGQPLNNRVQLEVDVTSQTADQCAVTLVAYPVDPVGNKLMFGVRGKPGQAVIEAFLGGLDG